MIDLAEVLRRHAGETEVLLRVHRGGSAKVFEVPMPVTVSADLFGDLKSLLGPTCLG
jgi:DNA polymerase-3 subunit alpha